MWEVRGNPLAAYYNEIDPYAAQWLRNLIKSGLIAPGEVDTRSIVDVRPDDLTGFEQCHFFAGIGGWSRALRLAGWPDDRAVWTGSCPCPPFSSAARGRRAGFDDPQDFWPAWRALIAAIAPCVVFGEQVAHGSSWIDRTSDDLEAMDYEVGATILPAISIGKDHTRPRVYFVGYANGYSQSGLQIHGEVAGLRWDRSDAGGMVSADGIPARMAVFSAFGNAIVPDLAAQFIGAAMSAHPGLSHTQADRQP
jgi:DNA (cytosine-5)-methyltransferase 1